MGQASRLGKRHLKQMKYASPLSTHSSGARRDKFYSFLAVAEQMKGTLRDLPWLGIEKSGGAGNLITRTLLLR